LVLRPLHVVDPDLVVVVAVLPRAPNLIDESVVAPEERVRGGAERPDVAAKQVVRVGVRGRFDCRTETSPAAVVVVSRDNLLELGFK